MDNLFSIEAHLLDKKIVLHDFEIIMAEQSEATKCTAAHRLNSTVLDDKILSVLCRDHYDRNW